MEQMADPGTILIAPSTLRLAEGAVQVTSLGTRPVRGLDAPVEVSELVGGAPARSKLRAADVQQLSRFIGRIAELERLHALLELARAGQGQVVAVRSEAGVGKTRLLHEFFARRRPMPGASSRGARTPTNGRRPIARSSSSCARTSSLTRSTRPPA
jgi:hypothetical protein